jgi:uncharacterized protein
MSNRLATEVSPYLLQHAENPVDWFPWGEEAFERAVAEDKLIFLSIGYATCHWCHVMERESFNHPEVAEMMNGAFINVKVDREEHPEVDSLYMDCAQALLGGGGGWPLNLVLTPDRQPIFAATYMPPEEMAQMVQQLVAIWGQNREELTERAGQLMGEIAARPQPAGEVTQAVTEAIADVTLRLADSSFGGLSGEPKFPMPSLLQFMLTHGGSRDLFFVQRSLEQMYRGGIYDHVGGGFSRYTVDAAWIIPHFEKMLYDNALLARCYCAAHQVTGLPLFRSVAESICDYVLREMTAPEGGFYSAQDADSEGIEGRFYTWSAEEIVEALGLEDGELFCAFYGVTREGNFEGRNVLHIPLPLEDFARANDFDAMGLAEQLSGHRHTLFERRQERTPPFTDDKVVTAWNGLMIRALAECGWVFDNRPFREAASRAATFAREKLWREGRLLRRARAGEGGVPATLDDYACLISGLISLSEAGQGDKWLEWAVELAGQVEELFSAEGEGYYRTDGSDPNLPLRQIDLFDAAEPSGVAVHTENLIRLHQLLGEQKYLDRATLCAQLAASFIQEHPLAGAYHCSGLLRLLDQQRPTYTITLGGGGEEEIYRALAKRYRPHAAFVWKQGDDTSLQVCREGVCEAPVMGVENIINSLN